MALHDHTDRVLRILTRPGRQDRLEGLNRFLDRLAPEEDMALRSDLLGLIVELNSPSPEPRAKPIEVQIAAARAEWEVVSQSHQPDAMVSVRRMAVPGGWLYQVSNVSEAHRQNSVQHLHTDTESGWLAPVFVPFSTQINHMVAK